MTYQEILEGIARHRANPVAQVSGTALVAEIQRKVNEIEWALQALTEKLRDEEDFVAAAPRGK
jgi:hypothetical protein